MSMAGPVPSFYTRVMNRPLYHMRELYNFMDIPLFPIVCYTYELNSGYVISLFSVFFFAQESSVDLAPFTFKN